MTISNEPRTISNEPRTIPNEPADAATLRTVYVSGGAAGLGAAVVQAVRKRGGTAAVLDRRQTANDIPFARCDLAVGGDAESAVADLVRRVGPPTAVVTAAGIDACGTLADVSADDWESVITVNLLGTAAVVRACLPYLSSTRGRVVTVASTLGLRPLPEATAYCASKFGVVGFTRALAAELAGQVGVTLLIPGGMRTGFFDGRPEKYRPAPDADLNDPATVAEVIVTALSQPAGTELREVVACVSTEPSWP